MKLFLGTWTYRSLLNDPDLGTDFDALEFGRATLSIVETGPAAIGACHVRTDLDHPTGMVVAVAAAAEPLRWPRWLRAETTPRREMLVIRCPVLRLGLHGTIWTWSTPQPCRSQNLAQRRPASATNHHRA